MAEFGVAFTLAPGVVSRAFWPHEEDGEEGGLLEAGMGKKHLEKSDGSPPC